MQGFRFFKPVPSARSIGILVVVLGSLFLRAVAGAQDAGASAPDQSQQAPPVLTVTTHEVMLDVVVTDAGRPVTGLKPSDFTVLEDGKPQAIASLEEHKPMAAAMTARAVATPSLPPNTFTNYAPVANTNAYTVILLDALNTRLDDQMSVRLALIKYLKHMQPGGPVAIFERDTKMHLVQGFTSDPQVLAAAAESERNNPELLKLVRGTREEYLVYRMDNVALGFQMMGRYLAAFPGRKNLIWFTGALPQSNTHEPMSDPFNDELRLLENDPQNLTAALTLSRVAVYPIDARGIQIAAQYEAASNRVPQPNSTINFEDAQGFQHTELDLIAESTGGRAFYSANGLSAKIAEIENNGSSYYALTYTTNNENWNGELRHIRIEVNRPHEKLQYRQGYYAVDRTKQEQKQLDEMRKAHQAETQKAEGAEDGGEISASGAEAQAGGDVKAKSVDKAAVPATTGGKPEAPKEGFEEAMMLGAVPPTQIIFTAHVSEGGKIEQLKKEDAWPQDNYLAANWKYKPFHTYTVEFIADAKTLHLTKGADGLWHGSIVFVSVVYDQMAQNVNSKLTTKNVDIDEEQYQDLLEHGLTEHHEIAVPAKGSYFLRLGLHDTANDHIGSFELAVDQVKPETVAQNK
jgi:VWFA-related protein